MKIQISARRLFATLATGYFALALAASVLSALTCALGGQVDVSRIALLPLGVQFHPYAPVLTGLRGTGACIILYTLWAALSTVATWLALRIGLWIAGKLPGVTLEESPVPPKPHGAAR